MEASNTENDIMFFNLDDQFTFKPVFCGFLLMTSISNYG